jgi:hypothetical protein
LLKSHCLITSYELRITWSNNELTESFSCSKIRVFVDNEAAVGLVYDVWTAIVVGGTAHGFEYSGR